MDREQEEMQFLGIFGVYKESYKIIFSWRKIFSQITLALILPLSFIFLAHIEISDWLLSKIIINEFKLDETQEGSPRNKRISDVLTTEWAYFLLFKITYYTFLLVFSLLSTAAVVYTIASIYTGRDITFKKVISVVPKVWKRLMVTFLCIYLFVLAYHFVSFILMVLCLWFALVFATSLAQPAFYALLVLYIGGLVFLSILWQLASVVSVLEDASGVKAMTKARNLIKGKMVLAGVTFLKLVLGFIAIQIAFEKLVVHGWSLGTVNRVCFGIVFFLLLFKLFLFGLVIQTVIYFVCKSYHHENIDKSALSDHLEVFLGEYVPLKSKDVQLEQFEV